MSKRKLTQGELADLIEEIAHLVEVGDRTLGHHPSVDLAIGELLRRGRIDGLGLLNRIALLSMGEGTATKSRYAFVAKIVREAKPLNPTEDSKALRSLVGQVRSCEG